MTLNFVDFGPNDVKAVQDGTADRSTRFAVLTSQTCGENCWHAVEDVCHCSCGGKNHGCLRVAGAAQPQRTSRIDGHVYTLVAVGRYAELNGNAIAICKAAGWKQVEKPIRTDDRWIQYRYDWRVTDAGSPARLKSASASQRNWQELSGWKDEREVYLLWQRLHMPERPSEPVIDRLTGLPLANQNPD